MSLPHNLVFVADTPEPKPIVPFPVGTATPYEQFLLLLYMEAILSRGDFQSFTPPRCLRAMWQCFDLGTLETEIGMEIQRMQGPPQGPCVCEDFVGPPVPTACERKPKECALCKLLKLANCPQDLFDILGCNDIKDCWKKLLRGAAILLGYGKLIAIGYDWINNSYAKIFLKSLLDECIIYDSVTGMIPVGVDSFKFMQGFLPMLWGMGDNQTGPCPPDHLDTQRIFEEILQAMDNQETAKPFVLLLRGYLEELSEQERIAFELWLIHELLWDPPKF